MIDTSSQQLSNELSNEIGKKWCLKSKRIDCNFKTPVGSQTRDSSSFMMDVLRDVPRGICLTMPNRQI